MPHPLPIIRRTAAEILASAVLHLFPDAQLIGGELTPIGFQYAFVLSKRIDEKAIPHIQKIMQQIINDDIHIELREMMRENAMEMLHYHRQPYLAHALANSSANIVSLLQIGEFFGYCSPPYLATTKDAGACAVLAVSTEWENIDGDEKEVTRIEGTAFSEKHLLKEFLKRREQAKKKDHQIVGPAQALFSHQEGAPPGCWSWLPKGEIVKKILIEWWTAEHRAQGYQFLSTPEPQFSKNHAQLFRTADHFQQELPIKYAEITQSRVAVPAHQLYGMLKCRLITADRAHSFCEKNQGLHELISSLLFFRKMVKLFHVDCQWYLVAKRETEKSERVALLRQALNACQMDYCIDPTAGRARIEGRFKDAASGEWRGPMLELTDLPEKMELLYRGNDGQSHRPLMIARSCFGSLERFSAILLEAYAGELPLWLAPEQVRVIPVMEAHRRYAREVGLQLEQHGIRVGIEEKNTALATKIYQAEREKIPFLVVVGDKEESNGTLAIRTCRGGSEEGSVEAFLKKFQQNVERIDQFEN